MFEWEYPGPYVLEEEWLGEVNRRSQDYVRWVQRSLNQILGAGVAVDGIAGRRTQQAVRQFQRQRGLTADGILGRRTEAALITAGAGPPPGASSTPSAGATLADLNAFSRRYVRGLIRAGRRLDCADLAIELWIRFGAQYRLPVSFDIWDSHNGRWLAVSRKGARFKGTSNWVRRFGSVPAFVRYVQGNLGARGLIPNTFAVPGGHRAAVAGDVFLWQYRNDRTGGFHRWGHTQVVDRVQRGAGSPNTDRITVVQGSLPPIVPYFAPHAATYFYQPRLNVQLTTGRGKESHTGLLVGTEPRRFKSFRNLR